MNYSGKIFLFYETTLLPFWHSTLLTQPQSPKTGSQTSYRLAPEDLGLARTRYEAIAACGDVHKEAVRFVQVISGTGHLPCVDLTCANAGAILYVAGRAADLPSGVSASRDLIETGRAFDKLCQWITVQSDALGSGVKRFTAISRQAGLYDRVPASMV